MKQLILASSSPARNDLLTKTKFPFKVVPSNYEEDMTLKLKPEALAIYLSQGKARDVAVGRKNAVILGADSFAVYKNELLGKPHTLARAKEMLTMLSGQCHSFITGFTIIDADSAKEYSASAVTKVYFRKLSSQEIENYLAKENVLKNAGAYRLQDLGATLVEKIEGDYSNVLGLPMPKVTQALKNFGINIL